MAVASRLVTALASMPRFIPASVMAHDWHQLWVIGTGLLSFLQVVTFLLPILAASVVIIQAAVIINAVVIILKGIIIVMVVLGDDFFKLALVAGLSDEFNPLWESASMASTVAKPSMLSKTFRRETAYL